MCSHLGLDLGTSIVQNQHLVVGNCGLYKVDYALELEHHSIPTQLLCNVVIASWRGGEGRRGERRREKEERKYTVHTSASCSVEGGDERREL